MGHTVIPARVKAEMAMALLKEAILDHLEAHPEGIGNADLAENLNLRSDQDGEHRNFLTYSVLGILISERLVQKKVAKAAQRGIHVWLDSPPKFTPAASNLPQTRIMLWIALCSPDTTDHLFANGYFRPV
jgi:hypothetical protein